MKTKMNNWLSSSYIIKERTKKEVTIILGVEKRVHVEINVDISLKKLKPQLKAILPHCATPGCIP